MCCSDKEVVQETLGSGSKQTGASKSSSGGGATKTILPLLAFPAQEKNPVYIAVAQKKCIPSMHACDQLLQPARATTTLVDLGASVTVLSFDCEWEVYVSGRRKVATVQLSSLNGYTAVFQPKMDPCKPGILPFSLGNLLQNEDVLLVSSHLDRAPKLRPRKSKHMRKRRPVPNCRPEQHMYTWRIGVIAPLPVNPTSPTLPLPYQTGVSAPTDAKFLVNDYGVVPTRVQNLAVLAKNHLGVRAGQRSLASLTAITLECHLPKDPTLRMSTWERPTLDDDQVCTRN